MAAVSICRGRASTMRPWSGVVGEQNLHGRERACATPKPAASARCGRAFSPQQRGAQPLLKYFASEFRRSQSAGFRKREFGFSRSFARKGVCRARALLPLPVGPSPLIQTLRDRKKWPGCVGSRAAGIWHQERDHQARRRNGERDLAHIRVVEHLRGLPCDEHRPGVCVWIDTTVSAPDSPSRTARGRSAPTRRGPPLRDERSCYLRDTVARGPQRPDSSDW